MRNLEAQVMLRIIDTRWMAHLQEMDYLKAGIGLRAFGQRDPLRRIQERGVQRLPEPDGVPCTRTILRTLLRLQVAVQKPLRGREGPAVRARVSLLVARRGADLDRGHPALAQRTQQAVALRHACRRLPSRRSAKAATYVKDADDPFANVGRNDPCPCGSGLKYKKCHGT